MARGGAESMVLRTARVYGEQALHADRVVVVRLIGDTGRADDGGGDVSVSPTTRRRQLRVGGDVGDAELCATVAAWAGRSAPDRPVAPDDVVVATRSVAWLLHNVATLQAHVQVQ
jgi:hypothetical protein